MGMSGVMASLFQSPHYAWWSLAVLEMGPSSSTAMGSSESAPSFALLACVALALLTELPLSHPVGCLALPSLLFPRSCREQHVLQWWGLCGVKPQQQLMCKVLFHHANPQRWIFTPVLSLLKRFVLSIPADDSVIRVMEERILCLHKGYHDGMLSLACCPS